MEEYQAGTTIILQAEYFNKFDQPLDADATPTIEIRDALNRIVQTGLASTKTSPGVYQCRFPSTGLQEGTYFHVWKALFNGYADEKSGSFKLKKIVV